MSRRIITKGTAKDWSKVYPELTETAKQDMPESAADKYADKLVKYIPADIIGAWLAAKGLILTASDVPTSLILWISFGVGLVLTFLWTLKQTKLPNHKPAYTQSIISTVAFLVWVIAMGKPFELNPLYGSLLLILFSLVIPLINPPEGEVEK